MPLTTKGICAQILGSLSTYASSQDDQDISDCKVVVNHLLRKFSEPAYETSRKFCSAQIRQDPFREAVYDHAIPVNVVMNWLLSIESKVSLAVNAVNIAGLEKILRDNLFLVKITKEQDDSLTELGLRDRMPADNWSPSGSGSNLPWDRYNELGIEIVECDGPIFRRSRKIKVVSAEHSRSR